MACLLKQFKPNFKLQLGFRYYRCLSLTRPMVPVELGRRPSFNKRRCDTYATDAAWHQSTHMQRLRMFLLGHRLSKKHLQRTGAILYIRCIDSCDYATIFRVLNLPDTFNSWFLVANIHVWLLMGRLMQDKADGREVRNELATSMWADIEKRMVLLASAGSGSRVEKKKNLLHLQQRFTSNLLALDRGLLGSDRALAATLYSHLDVREAEHLDFLVGYIRAQSHHLLRLELRLFLLGAHVHWLPVDTGGHRHLTSPHRHLTSQSHNTTT